MMMGSISPLQPSDGGVGPFLRRLAAASVGGYPFVESGEGPVVWERLVHVRPRISKADDSSGQHDAFSRNWEKWSVSIPYKVLQ